MMMNTKAKTPINHVGLLFLAALVALICSSADEAQAADETAASCSAADIQSAIDDVISSGGGTAHIPPCDADDTWADDSGIMVDTDVALRVKGSGIDSTVIGYKDGVSSGGMFFDGSGLVEISDLTFRGSDNGDIASGIVVYSMNTEDLRIHHLRLQKFSITALYVCQNPDSPMVIDHNEIGDQAGNYMYGVRVHGTNQESDFVIPASFGTNNPNAAFIEDNVFDNCYHSVSAFATPKVVLRHNQIRNPTSYVDGHGPCYDVGCRRGGVRPSGTYIYEIYDNVIDADGYPWCVNIRGGTGIVTDNTFTGCYIGFRLEMESCSPGANCTAANGCPHSSTDASACRQSPNQWWIWNNTQSSGDLFGAQDRGTGCIRENHEYFLHAPQAGDPVATYTKYPYPHPLVTGDSVTSAPCGDAPDSTCKQPAPPEPKPDPSDPDAGVAEVSPAAPSPNSKSTSQPGARSSREEASSQVSGVPSPSAGGPGLQGGCSVGSEGQRAAAAATALVLLGLLLVVLPLLLRLAFCRSRAASSYSRMPRPAAK